MSKKHRHEEDDSVALADAVPAERAGGGAGEKSTPPPFGSPKPMGAGDVPRFVPELARVDAGCGLKRYKIACTDQASQPRRYVLAKDEASAREHYLKSLNLNGNGLESPTLVVTTLPD